MLGPVEVARSASVCDGLSRLVDKTVSRERLLSMCGEAALQLDEGYWAESRHPWPSLVFIAPLLAVYEGGLLFLGPHGVRNGADAWLRQLLSMLGFGEYFLLPVLTVCILLGWHHTTRQSWRLRPGLLSGMAGECVLLSFCLFLLLKLQAVLFQPGLLPAELSIGGVIGTAVGYLGAGIYEELLFRLILLSGLAALLKWLGLQQRWPRMVAAVLLSSLLFAAAHYVGPYGDTLHLFSFTFRFLAGVFFSLLFVYRGFGIAAGTHAGYDILVGVLAG